MELANLKVALYEPNNAGQYHAFLQEIDCPVRLYPCSTPAELEAVLPEADVLVGVPNGLTPAIWEKARRLQYVQGLWAGAEGWLALSVPSGIPLIRMTGVFGPPISEFVIGHVLGQLLGAGRLRRQQAEHRWEPFRAGTLQGKTMGIAGIGDIGMEIARKAKAFDMTVWGWARRPRQPEHPVDRYFTAEQTADFLPGLDYLVLVLPKTTDTYKLFGEAEFARLPKGAVVVNVGRGHCLDEEALVASLHAGHLGGAILDVFQTEPLPAGSPLWDAPNCVVAPHMSGPTPPRAAARTILANLERFAGGEILPGRVDPGKGY